MSKKHRHWHRNDYELEHTSQSIVPEDQLIILIGLMLLFDDNNPQYDVVEQVPQKDIIKPYSFEKMPFDTKPLRSQEHEIGYGGEINNIIADDKMELEEDNLKLAEAVIYEVSEKKEEKIGEDRVENKGENIDDSKESIIEEIPEKEHIIARSKVTVYNVSVSQYYLDENDEDYYISEPAVIKLPIILSEPNIQVFIETVTKFSEPVFEIKEVNKKVVLSQCQLILGTNKLFIKGFIKEDVEYATAECIDTNSISGSIKKISLNIPFQGSAKVFFHTQPRIYSPLSKIDLEVFNPEKNGAGLSEKSYGHFEFLNEKVFAELDSTQVLETRIQEEIKILENTLDNAYTFENMRSKIILNLKLNLLQNQEVFIADCDEEEDTGEDKE